MHTFRAINIDTTGELADALRAFPGATKLKLLIGDKEDAQGAWGGINETGEFELHVDDEHDPRRSARLERERKAVRDAMGDERDVEADLTPSQRKARDRNKEVREMATGAGTGRPSDKFAEIGVKEAPAGQPTGAEDQNVREGQFDRNKTGQNPADVVTHRRAVERAADEPGQSGGDQGKKVPLQKAEATARNPASLASGGAPLPGSGPLSAGSVAAHEADVREQDAKARAEDAAKGKTPEPKRPA